MKKIFFSLTIVFLFCLTLQANADLSTAQSNSPRFLVHLLNYLAKDYPGAVADGKILNEFEYKEQLEFAAEVIALAQKLEPTKSNADFLVKSKLLENLILEKAAPSQVASLARTLQQTLLELSPIPLAPTQWPNLTKGREIYSRNCMSCHGTTGLGNGPSVTENMDPKPANFMHENMNNLSPFQAFNTVRLGIPGTSMVPLNHLGDQEIWDVAFYVLSLRHQDKVSEKVIQELHQMQSSHNPDLLKTISTHSDSSLQYDDETLSALRLYSNQANNFNSLTIAQAKLEQALELYKKNEQGLAKKEALLAYLEGVEPSEPKLKANNAQLTMELETSMGVVRSYIERKKPIADVEQAVFVAQGKLTEASDLIGSSQTSPLMAFLLSIGILIREGFEAILLIIVLLGVVRATKSNHAKIWIHAGWGSAVLLGVLCWFFSGWLMHLSGAKREVLEGGTALLAVGILLYFGFWLHNKTELHRWRSFLDGKVKKALDGGNLIVLAFISFIAVFREAFESVLFLRAVLLGSGPEASLFVGLGVLVSFLALILIAWILIQFSTRLPIRKLFEYSSMVLIVLAVILAGKGFHSLQESGLIPITTWSTSIRFDLMGIYPTLETILPQFLTFLLAISLWIYGKKPRRKSKNSIA